MSRTADPLLSGVGHVRQVEAERLMLDIDHFKGFNDRYGHDADEAVLAAFDAGAGVAFQQGTR